MTDLIKKTVEYVDYFDMRDIIEEKYKIDERDYKNHNGFSFKDYMVSNGYTTEEAEILYKTSPLNMNEKDRAVSDAYRIAQKEYQANHPYCDFWHFMLDYFCDFDKGKPMHLNWADVKEYAEEDWQKEIAQLYINEFGEEDYTVIVDW